jgi:hypothetical protein
MGRTMLIAAILSIVFVVIMAIHSFTQPPPSFPPASEVPGLTTLWPDIPVFNDSTADTGMNQFMNQLATEAMISIRYHTAKLPADIAAYYTDNLMKEFGWSPQPYSIVNQFSVGHGQGPQIPQGQTAGGCEMFLFHDQPAASCTFSKVDDRNRDVELYIDANLDEKTPNQTEIEYTRMVGSVVNK